MINITKLSELHSRIRTFCGLNNMILCRVEMKLPDILFNAGNKIYRDGKIDIYVENSQNDINEVQNKYPDWLDGLYMNLENLGTFHDDYQGKFTFRIIECDLP